MSEIKCNFSSGEYSYNIESNESKARENELLFRLYAYLSNKDKLVCIKNGYVASIKRRIKKASEQGIFSQDFNFFNLGKDNIDFLEKLKDELNNKDSKLYQIEESSRHTGRALINNHYIDFVEHFKKPNIFWLNVNINKYWQDFPCDTWQLGKNDGKIDYERSNFNKGDIAIFYQSAGVGIIQHIGRVYDVDDDSARFEILCYYKDSITLQEIRELNAFKNLPQRGVSKMQGDKELACIELIVQCFDKGEIMTQDSKNISVDSKDSNNFDIPLNQILYGPPGSGKTYHTIDKALEILGVDTNGKSRAELKKIFDEYKNKGQIEFVTFHQSFSYEEFVEGIKPNLDSKKDGESGDIESNKLDYKIQDGIFKKICKEAMDITKSVKSDKEIEFDNNAKVWKVSLKMYLREDTEKLQQRCFDYNEIRIGWSLDSPDELRKEGNTNDADTIECFVDRMNKGDFVCIFSTQQTIKAIGIITSDCIENDFRGDGDFIRCRKVEWIYKGDDINIFKENDNTNLTQKTVYHLWRLTPQILLDKIKEKQGNIESKIKVIEDNTKKPYILIIDEINRGNISKILGELITLIESSKRIGEDEELKVTLPYSNEPFGVPQNLYIIGTMNTADRSIALIDTALRRRFSFTEMMPDSSKLSKNCEGVDLQKLLNSMNNRIEFLLDREHTIGHAFFIDLDSINALKEAFQHKIIPLLQEYFYDDYAKINAVLNDNGMIKSFDMKDLNVDLSEDFVDSDKQIYRITQPSEWNTDTFKKIYNSKVSTDSIDSKEQQ